MFFHNSFQNININIEKDKERERERIDDPQTPFISLLGYSFFKRKLFMDGSSNSVG